MDETDPLKTIDYSIDGTKLTPLLEKNKHDRFESDLYSEFAFDTTKHYYH
jgi:hypothetical protein